MKEIHKDSESDGMYRNVMKLDLIKMRVKLHSIVILVIKRTRRNNVSNLFWNRILHVSDRFSVHHQESSTVHAAKPV